MSPKEDSPTAGTGSSWSLWNRSNSPAVGTAGAAGKGGASSPRRGALLGSPARKSNKSASSTAATATTKPAYTIADHSKFIRLKTHAIGGKKKAGGNNNGKPQAYYSVDTSCQYIQDTTQLKLLTNVVQEYCHPFTSTAHYQDRWNGFETHLSFSSKEDELLLRKSSDPLMGTPVSFEALPFRVTTIRIRPDCHHDLVLQAIHDAFTAIHVKPQHQHVQHRSGHVYQAIGMNVNTGSRAKIPYVLHAQLVTRQSVQMERHVLVRFFHLRDVPLMEEEMQDLSADLIRYCNGNDEIKAAQDQEPLLIQTQLQEACALIQYLPRSSEDGGKKTSSPKGGTPTDNNPMEMPSPGGGLHQAATSEYLRHHYAESWSVIEENERVRKASTTKSRKPGTTKKEAVVVPTTTRRRVVTPALSRLDWPALQATSPLVERIVSELELIKCTYNTLCAEETCRFGMRPCQGTLDRQYCFQLSQMSQQYMLLELQDMIEELENNNHETQEQYNLFVKYLKFTFGNYQLNWPNHQDQLQDENMMSSEPIVKLPEHHATTFPWAPNVMKALQDVSNRVVQETVASKTTTNRRQGNHSMNNAGPASADPIMVAKKQSLKLAQESCDHVYQAFCQANDSDQKDFIRKYQKMHMQKVAQRKQRELMPLLQIVSQAKTDNAMACTQAWFERVCAAASPEMQDQLQQQQEHQQKYRYPSQVSVIPEEVPLLEFSTFSGTGCVTTTQLILHSTKFLASMFGGSTQVFDLRQVHIIHATGSSSNSATKLSVMSSKTSKKLAGFSPSIGAHEFTVFVQVLQSLLSM